MKPTAALSLSGIDARPSAEAMNDGQIRNHIRSSIRTIREARNDPNHRGHANWRVARDDLAAYLIRLNEEGRLPEEFWEFNPMKKFPDFK